MKKILSTLLLSFAVFFGYSQVILNEIYPEEKVGSTHEFFELFNTSTNSQPVNLDCYTLVTLFEQSNKLGVYVLDLPNLSINAKSYFVGASANPFNIQSANNQSAAFSWNNFGSPATATGSLKGYITNGTNSDINNAGYNTVNISTNFTNLFSKITGGQNSPSGGVVYGIFLFNNGVYVNGFLGGYASTTVPSQIRNLPDLTITPNSACSPFKIDWSTITTAENTGQAAGSDNGYTRINDGLCGTWIKASTQENHTPNTSNGSATGTNASTLTTTQGYPCGTQVIFNITGSTSTDVLPVNVQLYIDNAPVGTLDANDLYQSTISVNSFTAGQQSFTVADAHKNKPVLLVYETKVGCFDKIVALALQSTGNIITEEKNICGSRVDFNITGATAGFVNNYALPINAYLYFDNGTIGTYEPDVDILVPQTAPSTNPKLITSFSQGIQTFNIPQADIGRPVILVYRAAYSCFDKVIRPATAQGKLTTTETNTCNKKVDVSITPEESAVYAFPITVKIYYNLSEAPVATHVLQQASPTYSFTNLPDPTKIPIIVYEPTYTCFTNTIKQTKATAGLDVGGFIEDDLINGVRNVNYFVEELVTDELAYPLVLEAWEDINKDQILDSQIVNGSSIDILLASHTINNSSELQTFTASLNNKESNLIVKATSVPTCAYAKLAIANGNIVTPVHFQSFTANRNKERKEQVLLKWETANEQNNRGFNVQRKISGEWKNIAFVFSLADNGNSNTTLAYEYKDLNTTNGVSQYQIQQVDYDGKTGYSEVRSIPGLKQNGVVMIYPNPGVNGKINLLFSQQNGVKDVIVNDMNGRIVKQYRQVTDNNLTIEGLLSGFYTIKITDRSTSVTTVEKVIIK